MNEPAKFSIVRAAVRMRDGTLSEPRLFIKVGQAYYDLSRVFNGPALPEAAVAPQVKVEVAI